MDLSRLTGLGIQPKILCVWLAYLVKRTQMRYENRGSGKSRHENVLFTMKKPITEKPVGQDLPDTPEEWVERYGAHLYRYALTSVRDPSVAEELVQETFLGALKTHRRFKGMATRKTWLTAILKNKIVDYIRSKNRSHPTDLLEEALRTDEAYFQGDGHWKIPPGSWALNPVDSYERKEFHHILLGCLADLPDRHSRVFMLREIQELETDVICKDMDITPTNCWVILYRARMKLRQCLEINWLALRKKES